MTTETSQQIVPFGASVYLAWCLCNFGHKGSCYFVISMVSGYRAIKNVMWLTGPRRLQSCHTFHDFSEQLKDGNFPSNKIPFNSPQILCSFFVLIAMLRRGLPWKRLSSYWTLFVLNMQSTLVLSSSEQNPYHFIVKATLSHSQANVCILDDDQYHAAIPPCHQFWFSTCPISKRTETSPIVTAVLRQPRETLSSHPYHFIVKATLSHSQANVCILDDDQVPYRHAPIPSILISTSISIISNRTAVLNSQGKHCHPTGHRTCKVPKSFHQANTTHTTLSSKLLSVTAKRMYAFWTTINTMPPCPHAINSDSQHVQSASERKHLQSSLLCSDSQGKHCHPTGHSLLRTCKVPKSFHQANTTHTTLSSKLLSVTAKRM